MKILIMNNYYYPNMMGGAEYSVQLLAEQLAQIGHEVYVLSMDGDRNTDVTKAEMIHGVYVYRSFSKPIYRRRILNDKSHVTDKLLNGWHSIRNRKMNADVKRVINFVRPDIIHTQNLVSMSYWVWKYAYKKSVKVIHTLRDYWLLDPTTNIGNSPALLTIPFRKYFKTLSNKYVAAVTSPSRHTIELFMREGYFVHSEVYVIVNAIKYDENLLNTCLDEKRNRTSETINFLFVGKASAHKGIELLVKAFIQCNLNATLTICGEGDLLDWIKSKQENRIVCLGKLSKENLADEYRKADVLVVPSLWEEPFGRIVIEGAQYGVPTIGSNRGGIPEIVNKLNYGDIFEPDEEKKLENLLYKYSSRRFLKTLCLNGPQHMDLYSTDRQVQCFSELYKFIRKNSK